MADLKAQLEALRLDEPEPPRGRWRWVGLVLLGLAVVGGVIGWRTRESLAAPEVETVVASVQQAGPAGGSPLLTASGYVVARRKAVVSAKIQGRLAALLVEEGSHVQQGQVIARLESQDYAAQLARTEAHVTSVKSQELSADSRIARAEADLAEAGRQHQVAERLLAEGIGTLDARDAAASREAIARAALAQSKADRAQSAADLVQAEADVRYQQAMLDNTLIKSPFDGTVVKKMAEVGESVAPIPPGVNISTSSGAIVALADLASLEAEVDVAESNVSKLGDRQPAEVVVEAFSDRKYRGALRQVIPTADRTKATVLVKVSILDPDKDLKPEMSAKVTFLEHPSADGHPPSIVAVPSNAVLTRDGASAVFELQQDGTVKRRAVSVGLLEQGRIVIKSGLMGGETLVASPPDTLNDGDRVRLRPR